MSGEAWLGIKKLKEQSIVLVAAKHNTREHPGKNSDIEQALSHLNRVLFGPTTAKEVAALAKTLMANAGITKLKGRSVVAVEFVFSLPAISTIDLATYFEACVRWVAGRFGGEQNILSAVMHLDEGAPHCHVLLLPLVNGRMNGSDMLGVGDTFQDHLVDFYEEVSDGYGLPRPPKRLSGNQKRISAQLVLDRWHEDVDSFVGAALGAILDSFARYPDRYIADLEIALPVAVKAAKSMGQLALSPGAGKKTRAAQEWSDACGRRLEFVFFQPV
jgi:hypothetical protein